LNERTRSLAVSAGVIGLVAAVALLKSAGDSQDVNAAGTVDATPSLEATYCALAEQERALVVGFFLEGYICCEGARIMYGQMHASLTDALVRASELHLATLLIDMNRLPVDDRAFAWELAHRFGIQSFNGLALLTPDREIHEAILGPHYFLPRLIASIEKLAGP
jgi:hypothetical protein